ncbi:MAG TPA: class I SAM-dependent methyltransferase [Candidatus Saccharimonadales bacterium]|nr:class I SAM-dependent methyltransferase [Candidatus Saccharimonadales bacterium]
MFAMVTAILVTVIALVVLVLLLAFALYQSSRTRIGYIPLPARAVPAVVKALGVNSQEKSRFFDLGCGDGRIIQAALAANPKLTGVGVEYHPMVVWLARWRLRNLNTNRVQIRRGDLLKQNLEDAAYVFTYLNHPTMALLEPKLKRELKSGARLVSCDFPLPHTKSTKTVKIGESWQLGQTLYIYEY